MPMGLHLGLGLGNPPQGIALEAETQAYLAAMVSQPSDAMKEIYNNLIKGLKGDGVWAKLDYLQAYYTAHDSWQDALLNLVNPTQRGASIDSGTPITFEVKKGFTVPLSATLALDTSHNPSQANTKMLYNDHFIMLGCHTVPAFSSNYEYTLTDATNGSLSLRSASNDADFKTLIVSSNNSVVADLGWEAKKWYASCRLSASENTLFYCCETDTAYLSSASIPNVNGIPNIANGYKTIIMGKQVVIKNEVGAFTGNRRETYPSYYVAGAGLTFTQFAALKARIQAYETAMGAL